MERPAYDPQTNFILIGEVDWCSTVTLQSDRKILSVKPGQPWPGNDWLNPYRLMGKPDKVADWGGWVYAVDADSGEWKWRLRSNYPIVSGVTPTAGGLVFFGDVGGNFHVLDSANGHQLWSQKFEGAFGGGVISYTSAGSQKIAAALGFTSIFWPTEVTTGKILISGVAEE